MTLLADGRGTASPAGGAGRGGSSPRCATRLRRVTWPSRKEVYATTLVVILTSVFFGVYLWVDLLDASSMAVPLAGLSSIDRG